MPPEMVPRSRPASALAFGVLLAARAAAGVPGPGPSDGSSSPRVSNAAASATPSASAPAVRPRADARTPEQAPSSPNATIEISAGGAELRLSRFEPTVAIRADGRRIALVQEKPEGGLALLFDTATGAEVQRWVPRGGTGWGAGFSSLQFLPDRRLLAVERHQVHVLGEDGGIDALWRADIALASPDGAWVASLGDEGLSIRAFGRAPMVVEPRMRRIQTLAFSDDGSRLAVVRNGSSDDQPAGDTEIVVFDRRGSGWRRARSYRLAGARQENDAAFLSRDRLLLDAQIIELTTGAVAPAPTDGLSAASSDGRTLLFVGGDGTARWARLIDGRLGPLEQAERPPTFADRGLAVAISPLGQVLWCAASACGLGPVRP